MDIVSVLINLLIIAAIIGLVWWGLQQIPLPQPARVAINVVLAIVGVLFLAALLSGNFSGLSIR